MIDLKSGDRIMWTHYYPDGRTELRSGTIVDRAPVINATHTQRAQLINWWVIPDTVKPSDLYKIIAVGLAGSRSVPVHGRYLDGARGDQYASKGELFSSNYAGSPTGGLAAQAVQKIHEWKRN